MKKIVFAIPLLIFLFISCDEIPNDVVDTEDVDYKVLSITAPNQFIFTEQDSVFAAEIMVQNFETLAAVWFNIITEDGTTTIKRNVSMGFLSTHSENEVDIRNYGGSTVLGSGIPSGRYSVEFFVEDGITAGDEKIKKVGVHNFQFLSGEENSAPVLSNLVFADSVDRGTQFIFSVEAFDDNGYADIDRVYYELFDPDGNLIENSQGISEFPMFDDGSTGGDQSAQDGRFTVALTFPASFDTGDYTFEITAQDNVGALSNTITHILRVK